MPELNTALDAYTSNKDLARWVKETAALTKPERVHLCDGSATENANLLQGMVHAGVMVQLNPQKRPNSFLARSSPSDVARVEARTFICSNKEEDSGPTNNWSDPTDMKKRLDTLFDGSMRGRTMYVVPYSMGPLGSPISKIGVQITDSAYAVTNIRIMTRMGANALKVLGSTGAFTPALHSIGAPLADPKMPDESWPCNPDKYITHFTDADVPHIVSYGSGYGGNAILGKKCHALRIASVLARREGWLAEHMLILKITSPQGTVKHIAACFPSACGKTNLAMLNPDLPGWKIECIGDDIAWLKPGPDGRLHAINPESGFFGVAPGTSAKTNPNALESLHSNCIYTNVAMTPDGDVWWEGMTKQPPKSAISWLRREWYPDSNMGPAAHPNSRFTAPASQCPIIADNWEAPEGVPIDAILMGGRRSTTVPLVTQALDWKHGVYMGATMLSETTAAAEGAMGRLRSDPFAMKPFIGYNVGDYLQNWLDIGAKAAKGGQGLPKFFFVNWFRKENGEGRFLWPGFGSNSRVLEWVFRRCEGRKDGPPTVETPIGFMPDHSKGGLNVSGLDVSPSDLHELLSVDRDAWKTDMELHRLTLDSFGTRLPTEMNAQFDRIFTRLNNNRA